MRPLFTQLMKPVLIAMALVASIALTVHASNVDMTGKWKLMVKSDTGTGTPVFDLKQEGKALSGSYKGRFGEAPVTGMVDGEAFKITYNMNGVDVVYAGKVAGSTCTGDADFGAFGKAKFTGKK